MSRPEMSRLNALLIDDLLPEVRRSELSDHVRLRYLAERRDAADGAFVSRVDVERRVRTFVDEREPLLGSIERDSVVARVGAEIAGLGPLEPYLGDPSITEVMVNGPDDVWVERNGRMESVPCRISAEIIERCIERIIAPLGLRIDRNVPFVDARLPDGSRLHAVIAPLALNGPCLTIRKFSDSVVPLEAFADPVTVSFLRRSVASRKTMLISGATGSGKTTLLGALSGSINRIERVVTIEETAELRLPIANIVRLEARLPTVEGRGEVTVRDLVRNALRMRPDRIIVGEVRGAEAFDMVQAMSTGHAGSLCTLHANSANDALSRVVVMTLLAGVGLPIEAVERQVARAVDMVVHVVRDARGRRVSEIARVVHDADGLRAEAIDLAEPCEPDIRNSLGNLG